MNWITTNIRLPENQYLELKIEAVRKRKSLAALIREKLTKKQIATQKSEASALFHELKKVAKRVAKENKGINLTKALIEMRSEQ